MNLLETLALLGALLIAAKLCGGVLERLGLPAVLGELGVGVAAGNLAGPFAALPATESVAALSELGILLLLFVVGLETDLLEIKRVGKDAAFAAVAGVVAPFALAFGVLPLFAEDTPTHRLFLAAALTATSVGITARVLRDAGKLGSVSGRIILGAAVIDDVLGIIVLAVVSALATQGAVSPLEIGTLLGKIALFALGIGFARRFLLPRVISVARILDVQGTVAVLLVSLTMVAAWAAERAGLAGIVGAFALGIALDQVQFRGFRDTEALSLEEVIRPVADFLVPVFFVVSGMQVNLRALGAPGTLAIVGVLIAAAVVGKLACGMVLTRKAKVEGADPLLVGVGMIPRGEVGLIFAAVGRELRVLAEADYAAVVAMVAATTLAAPALISWRLRRLK